MIKKIIMIFFVSVLMLGVAGCSNVKNKKDSEPYLNKKDSEGYLIGTSNKEDKSKLQVKIIIEKINIRKKANTSLPKIGIVKKDSIFDVLSHSTDEKYIWFEIETDNKIRGYIASEIDNPYIEINEDRDLLPPKIEPFDEILTVNYRTEIQKSIEEKIRYSDLKDNNAIMTFDVNYDDKEFNNVFPTTIKVTDSSNNSSSITIKVKISLEQYMKDGTFVTYNEMKSLQQKAKSLCSKYGLNPWDNAIGCIGDFSSIQISIANYSGTTRIGFSIYPFCNYDENLVSNHCVDENQNIISHDLISSQLKSLEDKWLPKYRNYLNDVKEVTGYNLHDLSWNPE